MKSGPFHLLVAAVAALMSAAAPAASITQPLGTTPSSMDCVIDPGACATQGSGYPGALPAAQPATVTGLPLPVDVQLTYAYLPGGAVALTWNIQNSPTGRLICRGPSASIENNVGSRGLNVEIPGSANWAPGPYQCQLVAWSPSSLQTSNASIQFQVTAPIAIPAATDVAPTVSAAAASAGTGGVKLPPQNVATKSVPVQVAPAPDLAPTSSAAQPPVATPPVRSDSEMDLSLAISSGADGVFATYTVPQGQAAYLTCRSTNGAYVIDMTIRSSGFHERLSNSAMTAGGYECVLSTSTARKQASFAINGPATTAGHRNLNPVPAPAPVAPVVVAPAPKPVATPGSPAAPQPGIAMGVSSAQQGRGIEAQYQIPADMPGRLTCHGTSGFSGVTQVSGSGRGVLAGTATWPADTYHCTLQAGTQDIGVNFVMVAVKALVTTMQPISLTPPAVDKQ